MNTVTDSRIDAAEVDTIDLLRRFHFGEPAAGTATVPLQGAVLPALLNAYRDASAIRYCYPLYLAPPGATTEIATPLSEHLAESLDAFAAGKDEARILRDNLPWLERELRRNLAETCPVDAAARFAEAGRALQSHLGLAGDNRERLEADLETLGSHFASGSQLLAYGPNVALHLMLHAIRHRESRHEAFRRRIEKQIHGLQALLDVEKAKSGDTAAGNSVGKGLKYFDTGALSGMLESRAQGSVEMPAIRRGRIETALETLRNRADETVRVRFVGQLDDDWFGRQEQIDLVLSDDPCADAAGVFEQDAARYAEVFAASRIASLEIDGRYNAAVHDSWFAGFDWQAFSDEEMQLVTDVVALVSADHLAGVGLPSFSRLLGSRMPVHVLSWVRAYDNPGAQPGEDPFSSYRFELGYFGIGHRQVVVAQTSAARHDDLLAGFECALDSNRASLHLINRGTQSKSKKRLLDPWFVASAALEGRAHPFVLVNPDAGDHAAERVSFDGNPQPDVDWPVEKLEYEDADGKTTTIELAFTFADYALLMPALHEHFRMVPRGFESPDLVTVDRYLALDEKSADRSVPFVWGIDEEAVLHRVVISRALAHACRDRLNYWHTLQELAGIHNFYVEAAIDRVISEQQAELEAEREALRKAHKEELDNVRSEAAGEAMGQLVDVLMGADLSEMVGGGTPIASMPAPAEVVDAEPVEVAAVEEAEPEEELSFDEPWLDTSLCTTCDDCISINKMMFAYNDDRQAIIRDPRAGPYADLVEAAEICPAKCIHPGKPLDPSESDLDDLIARAEPFN